MVINLNNALKLKTMPSKVRLNVFEIWIKKHTFYINNHSQNIFPCLSKFFPVSKQNSFLFPMSWPSCTIWKDTPRSRLTYWLTTIKLWNESHNILRSLWKLENQTVTILSPWLKYQLIHKYKQINYGNNFRLKGALN